jgi:Na+/melibiose symporter-like transporter
MGIILDNSGFDSGATVQANSTNIILGLTIGIGGLLSFGLALISYMRYKLSRKKVEDIQRVLGQRKCKE